MSIKRSRTVLHLAITENTALRVILYVAKDKIDWYNDHGLHKLVIEALYPVILENLVRDPSKKLKEENRTIQNDGFRILYRFTMRNVQQTLIKTAKDFSFSELDDEKPSIHVDYKPLSIYPYQLLVSVDDELSNAATLDSYFTTLL